MGRPATPEKGAPADAKGQARKALVPAHGAVRDPGLSPDGAGLTLPRRAEARWQVLHVFGEDQRPRLQDENPSTVAHVQGEQPGGDHRSEAAAAEDDVVERTGVALIGEVGPLAVQGLSQGGAAVPAEDVQAEGGALRCPYGAHCRSPVSVVGPGRRRAWVLARSTRSRR